jgi:hypothetical protein
MLTLFRQFVTPLVRCLYLRFPGRLEIMKRCERWPSFFRSAADVLGDPAKLSTPMTVGIVEPPDSLGLIYSQPNRARLSKTRVNQIDGPKLRQY